MTAEEIDGSRVTIKQVNKSLQSTCHIMLYNVQYAIYNAMSCYTLYYTITYYKIYNTMTSNESVYQPVSQQRPLYRSRRIRSLATSPSL